jgi:hypothetical protein
MLSRRTVLLLAGAGLAASRLSGATEFWNKKPPSEWTSEEIDLLLTKSPWAKEVTTQYEPGEAGGYPNDPRGNDPGGGGRYPGGGYPGGGYPGGGYPGGGMGGPRVGIGGIPGIDIGGRRRGSGRGRATGAPATVRWESAQPILEAQKASLPEGFAGRYVLAVSGVPPLESGGRRKPGDDNPASSGDNENLDHLKQFTSLQSKGKERAQPGVVRREVSNGNVYLFGFSREILQLSPEDREVTFETRLGRVAIKAKFDCRKMLYHGKLAV